MNLDWAWINRNLEMIGGLLVEHVILALVPVVLAFVISRCRSAIWSSRPASRPTGCWPSWA